MGSPIDSLKFPHCEYISTNRSDLIKKVYFEMLLTQECEKFPYDESKISIQYLDSTGRLIAFLKKSGKIIKLDKQYQPLGIQWKSAAENFLEKGTDDLNQLIFMKRFTRVFLEYCMIKYSQSQMNLDDFMASSFVLNENMVPANISDEYILDYYDGLFLNQDGLILIDNVDSIQRLKYNIEKMEKRNGKQKYIDNPFITSYFEFVSDFNEKVLTENMFKNMLTDFDQGTTLCNSLTLIGENVSSILLKNTEISDLNGRFKVFLNTDIETLILNNEKNTNISSIMYLWTNSLGFVKYIINGVYGVIIVVFKINDTVNILLKY